MAGLGEADKGVTLSTQNKRSFHWELWVRFLKIIELDDDPFLLNLEKWSRPRIGVAFAKACRAGQFHTEGKHKDDQQVAGGTVDTALGNIAQTFRFNEHPDPFVDTNGKRHFLLQQQVQHYKQHDGKSKQMKALPARVIRKIIKDAKTEKEKHIADLIGGAFFFACRSCEYCNVPGTERKTKIIEIGNVQFFKGNRELHHLDKLLHCADSVSVTFVLQKNDSMYETVTQWATGDADGLCPVKRWARLVQRIRSHPGSSDATTVNICFDPLNNKKNEYSWITAYEISGALKKTVRVIGKDNLGFTDKDVSTHSIRSGAAMAMHLTMTPVYTIMLIGRWSSDAFLRHTRPQAQDFAKGAARNMTQSEEFFTIPRPGKEDPRTSNHQNNFSGRGLSSGHTDATRPPFALNI